MRPITKSSRPRGFTLIELAVVIFIIGILLAFVLAASAAAAEAARVRATQALITKLSVGLEERMEAILATSPTINGAHQFLASVNPPGVPPTTLPWGLTSQQRAQVIARLDQIRAEFPDVFYIDPQGDTDYPIKFAGFPYPNPFDNSAPRANYVLPVGNNPNLIPYLPDPNYVANSGTFSNLGPGTLFIPGVTVPTGTGINGASYAAAASLNKLVGYTPKGCDGIDNNVPPNGLVDEYGEGVLDNNSSNPSATDPEAFVKIQTFLANHTHKTARSEMLYALLVGGLGPLGSVFTVEDFHDGEIKDTDNDGVPEFVDGWGEPLQFYRWPFAHHSEVQKGDSLYGPFETRERMPLDPNNQLTTLAWWCDNTSPSQMSAKCLVVQNLFGPLYDPFWQSGVAPQPTAWDRSGASPRRAFLTKFLIVSGGPDRQVGIPRLSDSQVRNPALSALQLAQAINGSISSGSSGVTLVPGESWALALPPGPDPVASQAALPDWARITAAPWYAPPQYEPYLDQDYSLDDLTNQSLQNQAGGFR